MACHWTPRTKCIPEHCKPVHLMKMKELKLFNLTIGPEKMVACIDHAILKTRTMLDVSMQLWIHYWNLFKKVSGPGQRLYIPDVAQTCHFLTQHRHTRYGCLTKITFPLRVLPTNYLESGGSTIPSQISLNDSVWVFISIYINFFLIC